MAVEKISKMDYGTQTRIANLYRGFSNKFKEFCMGLKESRPDLVVTKKVFI